MSGYSEFSPVYNVRNSLYTQSLSWSKPYSGIKGSELFLSHGGWGRSGRLKVGKEEGKHFSADFFPLLMPISSLKFSCTRGGGLLDPAAGALTLPCEFKCFW